MKPSRLFSLVVAPFLALAAVLASGFPIPGKPVRMVVPFPAGAEAADATARVVAQRLSHALDVPVVVENRPGGGTVIGNQAVASAPPDGHTLLYGVWTSFTMLPHQLSKRPYDERRDFTPITLVARSPMQLVVNASLPITNLRELVAYAKAHPGKLSYGSWQTGGLNHVYLEMLKADAGIDIVQVPYKGPVDALRDLLEGRVHLMMNASRSVLLNVRTGKLRSLAASSATRVPAWIEVPTFAEQGFAGYDHTGGIAIFGPARMPPQTVKRLNAEFSRILRSPDVIEVFTRAVPSFEVEPSTPEALASLVNEQYETMGVIIRRLGIRIDRNEN